MNCEVCKCPLMRLKGNNGRLEPRKKCARCTEQGALDWKPPKVTTVVTIKKAPPKAPPVYRAPRVEKPVDATVLRIDEFINRRYKKRASDG